MVDQYRYWCYIRTSIIFLCFNKCLSGTLAVGKIYLSGSQNNGLGRSILSGGCSRPLWAQPCVRVYMYVRHFPWSLDQLLPSSRGIGMGGGGRGGGEGGGRGGGVHGSRANLAIFSISVCVCTRMCVHICVYTYVCVYMHISYIWQTAKHTVRT